jgi:hypothetical protein
MSHDYTPDEVTFALYFDNELDHDEEAKFEAALNTNSELLARYNLWTETYEHICDHFEALEETYPLESFTERVMKELPQEAPWEQESSSERISQAIEERESSWFKRFFMPMLVGSLTVAVVVVILSRKDQLVSTPNDVTPQRSDTQLIDHKVTWLEDDEDEDEDIEHSEDIRGEDEGI